MGIEVAAAAALVGGAVQVIGQQKEGRAKNRAARAQAAAKRRQAQEQLRRTDEQLDQLSQDTTQFIAEQVDALASGNVDVGSGLSLIAFEDTQRKSTEERILRLEEARFSARELEFGARDDIAVGRDARDAANIRSIGTAINVGTNLFGLRSKGA